MSKEKSCPVCKNGHHNLTLHIRKYAMSEAFNKEFIKDTSTAHLDYLKKKYKTLSSNEPFILINNGKVKIVDAIVIK
jgi:hypothetical protein